MKRFFSFVLCLITLSTLLSSCAVHPKQIPPDFESITLERVQYNGWRNMIAGERYVFSSDGLGSVGMAKINQSTHQISDVCLKPNCNHGFPGYIQFDSDYCRASGICELQFTVGEEIFYTYHYFETDEEDLQMQGESKSDVICVFAFYNYVTGESRDLLKIKASDYEYMYRFTHSKGYIYYCRYFPTATDPKEKEDYSLYCCRMKLGDYSEEKLFAFSDVCFLPQGVLPDPIATEGDKIYFTCVESGRLLEVDLSDHTSRFYLGEGDVTFGTFDSPGAFYLDGYIYFTAVSPDLAGTEAAMFVVELHRVNCDTGKTEKLTEDLVSWFFVSDTHIYYGMAHGHQPTKAQLDEVGDDMSVHTVKRTDHDGKNSVSFQMKLSSPKIVLTDVVGIGQYLYFRAGFADGTLSSATSGFKVVFDLKNQTVKEFGREVKESDKKPA